MVNDKYTIFSSNKEKAQSERLGSGQEQIKTAIITDDQKEHFSENIASASRLRVEPYFSRLMAIPENDLNYCDKCLNNL